MLKRSRNVAKAQGKETTRCLKGGTSGKIADAQACLGDDDKDKVGRAAFKVFSFDEKKCQTLADEPTFGFEGTEVLNQIAAGGMFGLASFLLGNDLNAVLSTEKADTSCQLEVVKRANKVVDVTRAAAAKASKNILKGKGAPAPNTPAALGDQVRAALDADNKIAKAGDQLAAKVGKKCEGTPTALATLFPASCDTATTAAELATCVETTARCGGCVQAAGSLRVFLSCDMFDNGVADLSCQP